MEKTPRYTQRERNMVLAYAARHKDIIENKRTDAESNRKKDEVWLEIAKEFNARAYHQRSAKQLRQLYKNMKLLLKKDLSGEDRGNRSFMELLNTLANQDSVAQYITEQMSPDSAGGGGDGIGGASYSGMSNGGNGIGDAMRDLHDDYDDSKMHYENMDTDVILIKSETISDNEQENGMHYMDDDEDDDYLSPKAPEVCLEEEDNEYFATDLSQLNQQNHTQNSNGDASSIHGNGHGRRSRTPSGRTLLAAAATTTMTTRTGHSSPAPTNTKTTGATGTGAAAATASSASSPPPTTTTPITTLFGNTKPEITIQNVGGIRVGAFASLSKTLQNGNNNSLLTIQPAASPNGVGAGGGIGANNTTTAAAAQLQQLSPEQVQQHLLLNGLGLSAVHPPASLLPTIASNNNNTNSNNNSSSNVTTTRQQQQQQQATSPPITRLTRSDALQLAAAAAAAAAAGNNNNNNANNANASSYLNLHNGVNKSLLNGHHHHHQHHNYTNAAGNGGGGGGGGSSGKQLFNGTHQTSNTSQQLNHQLNHSNSGSSAHSSPTSIKNQHNEYLMKLAIEERRYKIELLQSQIAYWKTLTQKLDANNGHLPNPSCLCHFPGTPAAVTNAVAAVAGVTANGLQTHSNSS